MNRKKLLARQEIRKKRAPGLRRAWSRLRRVSALFLKLTAVLVVLALISLGFISFYGYLLTSPYIRLEQVEVLGVDEELKNELLEMAQLKYDHSLLAVDLNAVKDRLERHPWVRLVQVEKSFPHALLIRVEKQEPWALALVGKLHYMNHQGDLFKEVGPEDRIDLPVITGLSEKERERSKQLKVAVQVLRLFDSEEPPWDLEHLSEVHVKEDGTLFLYVSFMPGQIRLKALDMAEKLRELKKVVEHLASTGRIHMVKTIHLDYAEGAAVVFEKG